MQLVNDSQLQTPVDLAVAKEKLRSILSTWETDALSPDVIPIKLARKYTAGSFFNSMSLRHPDDVLLSCLQSLTVDLHLLQLSSMSNIIGRLLSVSKETTLISKMRKISLIKHRNIIVHRTNL